MERCANINEVEESEIKFGMEVVESNVISKEGLVASHAWQQCKRNPVIIIIAAPHDNERNSFANLTLVFLKMKTEGQI